MDIESQIVYDYKFGQYICNQRGTHIDKEFMNMTTKTPKIQTDLGMKELKDQAEQAVMAEEIKESFRLDLEEAANELKIANEENTNKIYDLEHKHKTDLEAAEKRIEMAAGDAGEQIKVLKAKQLELDTIIYKNDQ